MAWWPERVSFKEYALNKGLIKGLEECIMDWRKKNHRESYVAKGKFPME